jgi:hypothetical protein
MVLTQDLTIQQLLTEALRQARIAATEEQHYNVLEDVSAPAQSGRSVFA